ncbi:MAG: cytidine deaminase [Bacteroidaceae bacterium]|nr:cytidine deaminase [Bacteroidaceae bacterium]
MKTLTHTFHYVLCTYAELSATDRQLIDAAKSATQRSYAPYSHFHVGAAALLADGTIVTGTNQENAAYPSGLCAERTTLFYAGSTHPNTAVVALAIAAYTDGAFTATPIAPCGACRQVMLETEQRHHHSIRTLLYGTEGIYIIEGGTRELLPLTFDASFLE